ncbi:apolipoprotein N-acyltransferase [Rhodobacterales bacterium 52_120_T64]|nr:apolipoprotein N-acyltransferase [Rhodobacterales bacterium 52_120_T64]
MLRKFNACHQYKRDFLKPGFFVYLNNRTQILLSQTRSRISAIRLFNAVLLPFFLGIMATFSHLPFGYVWLSLASFALFTLIWQKHTSTVAKTISGFSYAMGYFLVSLHWVGFFYLSSENPNVTFAVLSVLGVALYAALFWASMLCVISLFPTRMADRAWLFGLAIPVADLLRTTLGQFPNAQFGYMWINTPLLQLASLGGVFLISLSVCLPTSLIIGKKYKSALLVMGLVSVGLYAANPEKVEFHEYRVAVIQHNAEQSLKWTDGYDVELENRLMQMALRAQIQNADLIIAPENAVTRLINSGDPIFDRFRENLDIPILFGAPGTGDLGQISNSAFFYEPTLNSVQQYDKVHLAPVAEKSIVPWAHDSASLFSGSNPAVFKTSIRIPNIAPLICYDGAFPIHGKSLPQRPDLLSIISADSLLGNFGALQARDQASIRAVETGIPVVRAAATGISAIIGPDGSVLQVSGFDTRQILIHALPRTFAPTLFWKFGVQVDVGLIIMVLIGSAVVACLRKTVTPRFGVFP